MLKTIAISIFSCLMASNCFAQKNPLKLPGTVLINDSISVKATEVSIKGWMDFIANNNFDTSLFPDDNAISTSTKIIFNDLKKGKGFEYLQIAENTESIQRFFGSKSIGAKKNFRKLIDSDTNYFSMNNPIVGVTIQQVQRFCAWKENVVNQRSRVKIKISLPSKEIYSMIIDNKDSLCKKENKCDSCQRYVINYYHPKCNYNTDKKEVITQGQGLLRIDSYWPTASGLYNLQGNAAEMTSTEGVAMGGSFRHNARDSYNDREQHYNKAEDWLGFRYIVTKY